MRITTFKEKKVQSLNFWILNKTNTITLPGIFLTQNGTNAIVLLGNFFHRVCT